MTKSWRASSRSRWCGRGAGGAGAACSPAPGNCRRAPRAGFGFALTGSQRQALAEIAGDMKSPHRMMRLLQGDVGSGKTVVALLAMLIAVESGGQAALLAPTEVLARQHHQVLTRLAAPAGVEIGLSDRARKGAGARLDAGEPCVGADPGRRRHARAVASRCRIPRSRAGGDRRAAPVRRRAAPRAGRQGARRRHAA